MEVKNYYQEIIGKINNFIDQNNYQEALKIVEQELDVAYIPKEYEQLFQSLHLEILSNLKVDEKNNHNWDLEMITNVLNDEVNEDLHLVAFYHLQSHNVRLILPVITQYFLNNKFNNINKTQLLYLLKEQAIDQTFKVAKTHGIFAVNPVKLPLWNETTIYIDTNKLLEKSVLIDNPSLYQICNFLLDSYFESLTPEFPTSTEDSASLASAIYISACSLQFIKMPILASCKKFKAPIDLTKKYLLAIKTHQIK